MARHSAATLSLPDVAAWWPHTHGTPALHDVSVSVGATTVDLGRTGFRSIEVDRAPAGAVSASRSTASPSSAAAPCGLRPTSRHFPPDPRPSPSAELAREAGMNMLRVPGTTIYEDQSFYELCDELGILVWRDFMFATFDYPADDAGLRPSVRREARDFLARTQACPSLAVLCGGRRGSISREPCSACRSASM